MNTCTMRLSDFKFYQRYKISRFNVRVFPGTELEHFALENGVPKELIEDTQDMSYEEGSETLQRP